MSNDKTIREGVLDEAAKLITGDRNETYGSPTENFQDTADVWNVLLSHKLTDSITPGEVAGMMVALKLVRSKAQPKRDNWVDIAGYAACGHEVDVETGRITDSMTGPSQTSQFHSSYGVGNEFVVNDFTPEPGVYALEDVSNPQGYPFLVHLSSGNWGWSTNATTFSGGGNSFTWEEIQRGYTGSKFRVVRAPGYLPYDSEEKK